MRHKLRLTIDFDDFFVTSDNHFGHNMMAQTIRKFNSTEAHDQFMVNQWNARVSPGQTVLALGDWSFLNVERTQRIMDQLNGTIFIVPGNHDDSRRLAKWFPERVLPEMTNVRLTDPNNGEKLSFVACHYPLAAWDGSDKGSLHLHGHLHSVGNEVSHHFCAPYQGAGNRFDVGIDNAGWFGYPSGPVPIRAVIREHERRREAWRQLNEA
jgi:calcineurin-like phosphoesterase family protein